MIYFDNSATTKINDSVLESYLEASKRYYGNPSSLHVMGEETSSLLKRSRMQVAELLQVESEEIFFTSGGTEGDNWAIKGTAIEKMAYGKHIISTAIEHPAVIKSLEQLEQMGWEVTYLSVDEKGQIDLDELKQAIRKDTVLVSIMAVNNEMGSIQPLRKISEILESHPSIHFHVDAVQAVGKIDLDLAGSRIDIAVFSGHKFHAPKGTGFIYLKKGRKLAPLMSGGGQEKGKRSGTENVPGNIAMAKALRLLLEDSTAKRNKLFNLKNELTDYLTKLEKVTVFTPDGSAPHIICFGMNRIRGEVIVHALEKQGIIVSTTSACSSRRKTKTPTVLDMGYSKEEAESAVRISLSHLNSNEEVQEFKNQFNLIHEQMRDIN
ncbi:cysteine desulfurase family protein [Alkalibacterium pelagium]|uniref:Cysteine desulfurase n=1 Tax=Alkalibacterium pelagium TaxID=426702 RepID=A0A1H7GW62_9LACT|nr:cysteine desulfurase family protein [Alkalibacterium pelagium]GEN49714.1 aminotransferase V [Alkalibacterium pelagium]SEK40860.1 cysteine desulfurase [Alkalibacterium pelagium]